MKPLSFFTPVLWLCAVAVWWSCAKTTEEKPPATLSGIILNDGFSLELDTTKYKFEPGETKGSEHNRTYYFRIIGDSVRITVNAVWQPPLDSAGQEKAILPAREAVRSIRVQVQENSRANNINSDITEIKTHKEFYWYSVTGMLQGGTWYHSTYGSGNFSGGRLLVINAESYARTARDLHEAFIDFADAVRDDGNGGRKGARVLTPEELRSLRGDSPPDSLKSAP